MELKDLDKICVSCRNTKIGTKLGRLDECLLGTSKTNYDGDLLTDKEVTLLNKMCNGAKSVKLGTLVNSLLGASKNGGEVPTLTEGDKSILNNGICRSFKELAVGDKVEEWIEALEEAAVDPKVLEVIASNEAPGDMGGVHFTVNQETHEVIVPGTSYNMFSVVMTLGSTLKLNSATITTQDSGDTTVAPICTVDNYPATLVVTKGSKSVTYTMKVTE